MKFTISAWNAVSPFHYTKNDWCYWAENGQITTTVAHGQDWTKVFLSAKERRRLSEQARQIFAAAWPLLTSDQSCPTVFVSHDGEINRSFQLWQELLVHQAVSPTSFALSVHNAVVGQWSLWRHDRSETVAISAREHGLEVGVTEAYALLAEGHKQVLVVVAEEPVSADGIEAISAPFAFALALLVTAGTDHALQYVTSGATDHGSSNYYSSSLQWIAAQCLHTKQWQQQTSGAYWQWHM